MNNFSRILTSKTLFKPISLLSMAFLLSACGSDDSTDQTTNPVPEDPQVPSENIAPTANAGADQTLIEQTLVTLDGTNSSDTDGTISSYYWQQTQGTSVTLNNDDQAAVSFNFTEIIADEALTFELTVTDDSGDTHTDETRIYIQFFKATLNDTGLTLGGNYPNGNNASCIGETVSQQDCAQGNDANNNDNSDGHSGFSYTKLDANGDALSANATDWSCVKDNVTGLIWEVKTTDGGLHDSNIDYRWGGIGAEVFGSEFYDDWNVLLNGSNTQALCGFNDWRVPHVNELEGLVNLDQASPTIDTDYFPNTLSLGYLSMNASVNDDTVAWYVHFNGGWTHSNALRDNSDPDRLKYVRLVRGPLVF